MQKINKTAVIKPITIIINQTINTGIFPDKLNIAKIIPIFKKDDETQFTNYRPISLLPTISKIFERTYFMAVNMNSWKVTLLNMLHCN